jgi:hypothetical protein
MPTITARETIRTAAEAAGWRHVTRTTQLDTYRTPGWELFAEFSARGTLIFVSARRDGHALVSHEWGPRVAGKAAAACAWLAEHPAAHDLDVQPEPEPEAVPLAPWTPAEIDALTADVVGKPGDREGSGTTHTVRTVRDGVPFWLTRVVFPLTGKRRYTASRYNGYSGGERWGCAWDHLGYVTIEPEQDAQAAPEGSPGDGTMSGMTDHTEPASAAAEPVHCAACGQAATDADPIEGTSPTGNPIHARHLPAIQESYRASQVAADAVRAEQPTTGRRATLQGLRDLADTVVSAMVGGRDKPPTCDDCGSTHSISLTGWTIGEHLLLCPTCCQRRDGRDQDGAATIDPPDTIRVTIGSGLPGASPDAAQAELQQQTNRAFDDLADEMEIDPAAHARDAIGAALAEDTPPGGLCVHGLTAGLCFGPDHYPADWTGPRTALNPADADADADPEADADPGPVEPPELGITVEVSPFMASLIGAALADDTAALTRLTAQDGLTPEPTQDQRDLMAAIGLPLAAEHAGLPIGGHASWCIRTSEQAIGEHLAGLASADIEAIIPDHFAASSDEAGLRRRAEQLRALALRHLSEGDVMCVCSRASVHTCVRCSTEIEGDPVIARPYGWPICLACARAHSVCQQCGHVATDDDPVLITLDGETSHRSHVPTLREAARQRLTEISAAVSTMAGGLSTCPACEHSDPGGVPGCPCTRKDCACHEYQTGEHAGPVERTASRLDAADLGKCWRCGHTLVGCTCGPPVTEAELADVRTQMIGTCERAVRHGQDDLAVSLREVLGALVDAEASARRHAATLDAARARVTEAERVLLVDQPEGPALAAAEAEALAAQAALVALRGDDDDDREEGPVEVLTLVVPAVGPPVLARRRADLEGLQAMVGGWIEHVSAGPMVPQTWAGWVDEEGKLAGKPDNRRATRLLLSLGWPDGGDVITGTLVLTGTTGESVADLPGDVIRLAVGMLPGLIDQRDGDPTGEG